MKMYWTLPSALFFIGLFLTIAAMGVWDRLSPNLSRKGFLPIVTSRGDRLFIGIMSTIGIHLLWLAAVGTPWIWIATGVAALWFGVLARWG